jgi:acid phosphatase
MKKMGWLLTLCWIMVGSTWAQTPSPTPKATRASLPKPTHIVIVMEENRSFDDILGPKGKKSQPYLNSLAEGGADMVDSFAVGHNSEMNYMALFSGDPYKQFKTEKDNCPVDVGQQPNMAVSLLAKGYGFAGYSEDLPSMSATVCRAGKYARKHSPWVNFQVNGNIPVTCNQPFTSFPTNFNQLPTVSWVIPNLDNDMHDGTPQQADIWLKKNLAAYADWCKDPSHNSLLIIQWDEDDKKTSANQIPTIFYGAMVKPGKYTERIDHYSVLRTILDMYHIPAIGKSAGATTITDIFQPAKH